MIWTEPKLLFIHIPKTAGSSIEHYMHRSKSLTRRDGRLGQHSTMRDAVHHFGSDVASEFTTFTVVRNTWERILSFYLMYYRRQAFTFATRKSKKQRRYVSFSDFYRLITPQDMHAETVFHYLAVDGEIPSCIRFLHYDNIVEEFMNFWRECEFEGPEEFPHINKNKKADDTLREFLLADPEFVETIGERYREEIDYFGFEPPIKQENSHEDATII